MKQRKEEAGSTLVELLITTLMMAFVFASVFLLFGIGSRGFHTVSNRQDTHNQLGAVRASLQSDLQLTHFYGIGVEENFGRVIEGESVERDTLSAVALEDWEDSASFNPYGLPQWQHWVVYRVTQEDAGTLLRHLAQPPAGQSGRALLRAPANLPLWANSASVSEPSWANLSAPRLLAERVRAFDARLHDENRAVEIQLTLRSLPLPNQGRGELVTANFFIQPHNTVPVD